MANSDLEVKIHSIALAQKSIDLICSGSIAAIESPRLIRALRRLGAHVRPYLTDGGRQFITPMALSWAANHQTVTEFSGTAPHIASGDALVVAPASASFIQKIAHGVCDSPASALAASYLGQKKRVLVLPNMHDSLFDAPAFQKNLATINPWVTILGGRLEEGKQKFPEPKVLADEIAHCLNNQEDYNILISMGTTRGYVDDVRYFSNYSSGGLGTAIAEEAYRQGQKTHIVCGPCQIQPQSYHQMIDITTNAELQDHCLKLMKHGMDSAVLASSVLDFIPKSRLSGKISSQDQLEVEFEKTQKIIPLINPASGTKIGFKLEPNLNEDRCRDLAQDYMTKYNLSLMVLNDVHEVSKNTHKATIFSRNNEVISKEGEWSSKQDIATVIINHTLQRKAQVSNP